MGNWLITKPNFEIIRKELDSIYGKENMALVKEFDEMVFTELAKTGYETMFEDKWDDLHPKSIERTMWLGIAQNVIKRLRELYSESEKVST